MVTFLEAGFRNGKFRNSISPMSLRKNPLFLHNEIRRNIETLKNFLREPDVHFDFANLTTFYEQGTDSLMKKHHKDLYVLISSFKKNALSRFTELEITTRTVKQKVFRSWSQTLSGEMELSLEKKGVMEGANIARAYDIALDLIVSINPDNVLPAMLKKDYDATIKKISARCLQSKTAFKKNANIEIISQSLLESATPEVEKIIGIYSVLDKENKKEGKEILLLLQKYIADPI